jgi:hypothetical protein
MSDASRRRFLASGLALPATALAVPASTPQQSQKRPAAPVPASAPTAQVRQLGKTGLKVSSVGFGCMLTSDTSVINRAMDQGVNFFDTARVYQGGNNERMVGAALKGRRKDVVLCTKSISPTKAGVLADLDTSLKELQTDYLDVWYLHSKSKPEDIKEELLEAQQIAKQQGKIRFAGISTHIGHRELIPAVIKTGKFDVLLVSYNFTMQNTIDDLLEQTHSAGIGVVAMKVMAGGYTPIRAVPTDPKVVAMLHREGAFLAALKWVLRTRNVDTTIPSIVDVDQLEENLRAMSAPFTLADGKILAAHLDFLGPRYCRMCGKCDGTCRQGLQVADMLRFLTYAEGYGQFALAREKFLEMPSEHAAVRCGDCSGCTVQCANGVKVAERLSHAQELFA